jgi:pimeloyl-ACP methyl ester carboxylesterase
MINTRKYRILLISLCLAPLHVFASSTNLETFWVEEIKPALKTGTAEMLDGKNGKFLGIYTEQTSAKLMGGIILLHSRGTHPDWQTIIAPLRKGLPKHGWSTLSLQMPVLGKDEPLKKYIPLMDEATPRIDAGIQYLMSKKARAIIIIGHGLGAQMAIHSLAKNPQPAVKGLVTISMSNSDEDPVFATNEILEKIRIPVLDIYGDNDQPDVIRSAKKRGSIANSNRNFQILEINGANQYFSGQEDIIIKRIRGWLRRIDTN